ncbi:class I SAM-dependent methyltransferase [Micromonospora sp. NPDC004704]
MSWWLLAAVLPTAPFAVAALTGAPYLPTLTSHHRPVLALAALKPGQTLVDLGSGDGYLLRAAAAQGVRCIGYEINPLLWLVSRLVTWRYRHLVTVHLGNYWHARLPPVDVIYVFLIARMMPRLDAKLRAETTTPTTVVSLAFELPRTPIARVGPVMSYRY